MDCTVAGGDEELGGGGFAQPTGSGNPGDWSLVVLIAHLVLLPFTGIILVSVWQSGGVGPTLAAGVAAIALHVGLGLLARRPRLGFVLNALAMLLMVLTPLGSWVPSMLPSALCFVLALWWFAANRPLTEAVFALAIGITGVGITELVAFLRTPADQRGWALAVTAGLLLLIVSGSWLGGLLVQRRRRRQRATELDRLNAAVVGERFRIRRDLHDVIAHTITVLVARTEAAAVTTKDPATRQELGAIAETGRDAHSGLRAMLATLEVESPESSPGDLSPKSLAALPSLIAATASPLHLVSLSESGARQPLSLSVEVAVLRTIQESLTNAIRHLRPPVQVRVKLTWTDPELAVEIADDGGSAAPPDPVGGSPGTGLVGLAERVRTAQGTLTIDRASSGWTVTAKFPTKNAGDPNGD